MKPYKNNYEFKQSTSSDVLDIYIYSAISPDYTDWWTGEEVESETSAKFFKEKLDSHPNVSEIRLFVNSEGGSVKEAMGIRALLDRHPAKKIAYIDGWAASAASFIVTICDEVNMYSSSMQMLHNMWIITAGNSKELRQTADMLDKMTEGNRQAYLSKAGDKLTEERLIELMEAESWLTAKDCMECGLADSIITERNNQQEQLNQLNQYIQSSREHEVTMSKVQELIDSKFAEFKYNNYQFAAPAHNHGYNGYSSQVANKPVELSEPSEDADDETRDDDGVTYNQRFITLIEAILNTKGE